jgi:hypothetical protein
MVGVKYSSRVEHRTYHPMTLEQPNPSHILLAIAVTISLYVSSSLTLFDMAAASVQNFASHKLMISFVRSFTTTNTIINSL